jgi:(p)ppGpp synthase/HD superfamily hydrolase
VRNIALRRRTNEHAYTAEVVALLLRDTVEDTDTRTEELRRLFGDEIAATVLEVTDDKSLPAAGRKRLQIEHAPHLRPRAKLVKSADKFPISAVSGAGRQSTGPLSVGESAWIGQGGW